MQFGVDPANRPRNVAPRRRDEAGTPVDMVEITGPGGEVAMVPTWVAAEIADREKAGRDEARPAEEKTEMVQVKLPNGLTYKVPRPVAEMLAQAQAPARAPAPNTPAPESLDAEDVERTAAFMTAQGYTDAPAHRQPRHASARVVLEQRGDAAGDDEDPAVRFLRDQGY